jgi:hypothetical protein
MEFKTTSSQEDSWTAREEDSNQPLSRQPAIDPEESLTNPNRAPQTARSPVTYPSIRENARSEQWGRRGTASLVVRCDASEPPSSHSVTGRLQTHQVNLLA